MHIDVQLFATLRDRAGSKSISVDIADGATVAQLVERIAAAYPALATSLPSSIVAVNQEFAFPPTPVREGDEVALFPPVSGGSAEPEYYRITADAIDLNAIVAEITRPSTGAVCTFTGTVRGQAGKRRRATATTACSKPRATASTG
jgi:molybdopterin synthase catalytic subunit